MKKPKYGCIHILKLQCCKIILQHYMCKHVCIYKFDSLSQKVRNVLVMIAQQTLYTSTPTPISWQGWGLTGLQPADRFGQLINLVIGKNTHLYICMCFTNRFVFTANTVRLQYSIGIISVTNCQQKGFLVQDEDNTLFCAYKYDCEWSTQLIENECLRKCIFTQQIHIIVIIVIDQGCQLGFIQKYLQICGHVLQVVVSNRY
eukprot:TRINITY_DN40047_c0_g1_i1.p2 TRINITY_DN40047_c0_g1~~TRINITY_DN40047_c0_g1_i1.p2  ORF type:complete len:202 (+),score=-12.23 TRINITY_DN40047_c0_g1_i1:1392-1997(+)